MKQMVRAFSTGLLTASIIIGVVFLIEGLPKDQPAEDVAASERIARLEAEGYYVYKEDMEDQVTQLEEEIDQLENQQDTLESDAKEETETEVTTHSFSVEPGMTVPDIVDELLELELIESEDEFITYLQENELTTRLQVGEFELSDQMTAEEIADHLTGTEEEE
ncbi:endolytic transglycosylase MltG [Gracilibacillus dipsosauri]|uniref:Endolytic transglycosylase MltG n=1 Tax=Gracilibacillus dipsosauri TaxID=178340 RepID=A0A317KYS6_9BACI|nr:endolytic transglycosylase MltG [Gracilibacillus dipsosauri]PWU68513.1 hypothetical protein DLJ74_08735 [Gracilibacillus dipsosauri]